MKKTIALEGPRIRGRSAEIEEPLEDKGKWVYEVSFWDLAGEKQLHKPAIFGPFDTQEKAQEAGRVIVREFCDAVTGIKTEDYFDMQNGGVIRPWVEQ